ncbi:endonuclease/exonuclease/phosphatase family domain-containing protein 1 [Carlito syrichta]|uniref:Endonuclease/exonuclease/phosphatase family domain-containing protein 1 n=1 Tax=Carlito syrichta TaxID=1868482 RepID=A0A1U7TGT1_CARSF|nr:endonuclease/exonuclease/phosphatase family domain-containing protein 1 [Carlito syrichta]
MGSTLGCHRSIPRDPSDLSHSRKFSAACNFSNILVNQERLNINTATEEELMTLPGVTRAVARSIVEYRAYIGGFKKVEDLALVSGVGATKLEQVKFEICVSSKGSSAQHSPSSLRRDLLAEQQPHHLATAVPLTPRVNINTATPAQLMSVRGLSEKMALSIVDFRREHGPFRSIEDLVRMDGINAAFLDRIRHQVFAERSRPPSTHTNGGLTFTAKPHPSPTSLSLQSEDLDLPPGGPTQIISTRPSVEAFGGTRDGRPVLRLATWNLQGCSVEKANNPGVREVVCMTLLENSFFLVSSSCSSSSYLSVLDAVFVQQKAHFGFQRFDLNLKRDYGLGIRGDESEPWLLDAELRDLNAGIVSQREGLYEDFFPPKMCHPIVAFPLDLLGFLGKVKVTGNSCFLPLSSMRRDLGLGKQGQPGVIEEKVAAFPTQGPVPETRATVPLPALLLFYQDPVTVHIASACPRPRNLQACAPNTLIMCLDSCSRALPPPPPLPAPQCPGDGHSGIS